MRDHPPCNGVIFPGVASDFLVPRAKEMSGRPGKYALLLRRGPRSTPCLQFREFHPRFFTASLNFVPCLMTTRRGKCNESAQKFDPCVLGGAADLPLPRHQNQAGRRRRDAKLAVPCPNHRAEERHAKNGTARLGNATRARGRPRLWKCASKPENSRYVNIMSIFCNMYRHYPAHQTCFWGGAAPSVPRLGLIMP